MSLDSHDVPVIRSKYDGRYPCPLCDQPPAEGDLIAKRWGRWVHETCYRAMTPADRWALTQRVNARGRR